MRLLCFIIWTPLTAKKKKKKEYFCIPKKERGRKMVKGPICPEI